MRSNFSKRLRRIVNKRTLSLIRKPSEILSTIDPHVRTGGTMAAPRLLTQRFMHIANFATGNAGDTLLPVVLRDLFDRELGPARWRTQHAHDYVGERELHTINSRDALILGGGGLFLRDTNPNHVSGWQWTIDDQSFNRISAPIVVFAVGYNRFRGQEDFDEVFTRNLQALVEKSTFFGLRNHGSIAGILEYLPEHLHKKVVFQPCMTTVMNCIYPALRVHEKRRYHTIGLNCAFDRLDLRFGNDPERTLLNIARAMKQLSRDHKIRYISHARKDDAFLPYLDRLQVPYEFAELYGKSIEDIVKTYATLDLAVGMRGHAQMIPFGCGTPILSIISHDKMQWFLDDIDAPQWGVEVLAANLEDQIVAAARTSLEQHTKVVKELVAKREVLWGVTQKNMARIRNALFDR